MKLTLEIPDELLEGYEEKFGTDNVYIHNMEESAEYIQAVSHVFRGKSNGDSVIEEMADALICMMHLLRILDRADDLVATFKQKQGKALRQISAIPASDQCVRDPSRLCECWVRLSNGVVCPLEAGASLEGR